MSPINKIIKNIPNKVGVYKYFDKSQNLIYIGKAKNLQKRVSSYFSKNKKNKKTRSLVAKIHDIKYVVVKTELDALLLENNLIKKYQPKYNVLLKDDKSYPWICIKNEPFPRIFKTRRVIKDGSRYFGPYSSVKIIKTLLDFFHQLYPLRTCSLNLNTKNISNNKFKVCLEYHMKNCLGPCVGKQTNKDYLLGIDHIKKIITGDIKSVIKYLNNIMNNYALNLEYEKAQNIKEKITLLNNYQYKSTIVNPKINNVDVFTIVSSSKTAFVNFLKISSGSIIQAHTLKLKKKLDENEEELLRIAIIELRERFKSTSNKIYCSHYLECLPKDLNITVPKIGDKKKLVELSLRNAKYMQINRKKEQVNNETIKENLHVLKNIKLELNLKTMPKHIECFDISNTQGKLSVASCVVFKNGEASKKDYRCYNIKTVTDPNDFSSIQEVVFRRYNRFLNEKRKLPELIIIDGGKGQLSSALKSLTQLRLKNKINIIAIAKRLEEIYFPGKPLPIIINKRSLSIKLIQQLRNEAHRFALFKHRKKREKKMISISLEKIPGIGAKTIDLLITHFGSTKNILSAKKTDLIGLIGKTKTSVILNYYNKV